ncbi:MAG: DUF692 family protein [Rhizobiales bacterium]|nr:DUF692 family protein [Hyphomicrobiales bacterium]
MKAPERNDARNSRKREGGDRYSLPARAGVSLKPDHYEIILAGAPDVGFFEVHPENYMGDGGPPHHFLSRVRERYSLSLHGVGLSIGGARDLDRDHLARLKTLIARYRPAQLSEHLAWSTHDTGFMNDLLPLPYTEETLAIVCRHIDEVQDVTGVRMLLENPSTYVAFRESDMDEIDFLEEVVRRTGCGLLLDVSNVFVSSTNRGIDPQAYLERFPLAHVGEVHLAGHAEDVDDDGARLLIDSHDRSVIDAVWELYGGVVTRMGPVPTLIEWDEEIPSWEVLFSEARTAEAVMRERAAPASETLDAVA